MRCGIALWETLSLALRTCISSLQVCCCSALQCVAVSCKCIVACTTTALRTWEITVFITSIYRLMMWDCILRDTHSSWLFARASQHFRCAGVVCVPSATACDGVIAQEWLKNLQSDQKNICKNIYIHTHTEWRKKRVTQTHSDLKTKELAEWKYTQWPGNIETQHPLLATASCPPVTKEHT